MKIGEFNLNSMFNRPKAMNLDTWEDGKTALEDCDRLNVLIQEQVYTDAVKTELLSIMKRYDGLLSKGESDLIVLLDNRGKFLKRPTGKPVEIVAAGRNDWIGWFELASGPVDEAATENTARIIGSVGADVLCVIEVENRISLSQFNHEIIHKKIGLPEYDHAMLIDGNDPRGIDVGILARSGCSIPRITSHVDDTDNKGLIFSRDCAEYEIHTPNGNTMLLLVNHFKSKGYGDFSSSTEKRCRQAKRVREIYNASEASGYEYIAIVGDLNETPENQPLDPLLREGSDLQDIMSHPNFTGDGRPGTFGNGTKSGKFDYILMSPKLSAKVTKGGIERSGVWGGEHGTLFPHLPTITKPIEAASDHAALWAEVDL